jgi:hypothetical protein
LGEAVIGLEYTAPGDTAYRTFKVNPRYVSDAALHIHWSKSGDADESGKTVRFRVRYKHFDGQDDDVVGSAELIFNDTYDDAGTTSRIVYRTTPLALPGVIAGNYMGVAIDVVAAGTTLASNPVIVSADLAYVAKVLQ